MLKRSHKYCQQPSCVFNRQQPGQLASKAGGVMYCVWCDEGLLRQALQSSSTEMHIKVSLECFKKRRPDVYLLALEKLDGFEVPHNKHFCSGKDCVYSTVDPGGRARVPWRGSDVCRWCDPEVLEASKGSAEGRKLLNQALSAFRPFPEVYEAALARVGSDFVRASHYCSNTTCCYSYKKPGERACAYQPCVKNRTQSRVSDMCFWCDLAVVSAAQQSPAGIRRLPKISGASVSRASMYSSLQLLS